MEVYAGLFQQEMLADVDLVLRAEARTSSAAPPPAAAAGEQAAGAEAAGEQAAGAEAAGEQAAGAAAAGEQGVPAAPSEQPALAAAADTAPAADAASAEQPAAHAAGIEPAAAVAATAQQQPPGAAAADQQPAPAGTAVQQQQQQPADAAAPDEQPRSGGDAPPSKRQRLDAEAAAVAATTELARFPAHRLILWRSEYFRCQIERWQLGDGTSSSSSSSSSRPQLALTLARPDQHAAATAVLAAMYGVRGALGQLEHAQLVDAVLLADMLQAPDAVQQAVDALKAAAGSEAGLSAAAHAALSGLAAWPSCLAPLLPAAAHRWCRVSRPGGDAAAVLAAPGASAMQQCLLSALGDLERVWADEQLTKQLLALPLPAMQLLLASDKLQVASEDTVLYTAERYVRKLPFGQRASGARERLAVLVRAPQLSGLMLSAAARVTDAGVRLLGPHLPQLRELAAMARLQPSSTDIQQLLPDAPAAWHLGPRRIRPLPDGVQLLWRLPVSELAAACRRCAAERELVELFSPTRTPPLGGLAWQLTVQCDWQEDGDGGCDVGVYCSAVDAPRGVYYKGDFSISDGGIEMRTATPVLEADTRWGWPDFFRVGAMRGGWDAAAWAAKGLPSEGEHLELRLAVHEVF